MRALNQNRSPEQQPDPAAPVEGRPSTDAAASHPLLRTTVVFDIDVRITWSHAPPHGHLASQSRGRICVRVRGHA
jgi:hypothetical protein